MNPTDPKTLDPYMYAANNPILYQDASGLCYGKTGAAMAACQQDKTAAWTTFTKSQVPATPPPNSKSGAQAIGDAALGFPVGVFEAATWAPRSALETPMCWAAMRGWDACWQDGLDRSQQMRDGIRGFGSDWWQATQSGWDVLLGNRSWSDHWSESASPFLRQYTYGPTVDKWNAGDHYGAGKDAGILAGAVTQTALAGKAGGFNFRSLFTKPGSQHANAGKYGWRSDTSHIFRKDRGHYADDTPGNRAAMESIIDPQNLSRQWTNAQGGIMRYYRENLQSGRSIWVETLDDAIITNGGFNAPPGTA